MPHSGRLRSRRYPLQHRDIANPQTPPDTNDHAFGFERFLALMEEKLGAKLPRVSPDAIAPRPAFDRSAHVGVHPQKQDALDTAVTLVPLRVSSQASFDHVSGRR